MIRQITFEEIYPLWERLWPGRDNITPYNSMTGADSWDLTIHDKVKAGEGYYGGVFWGVFTDDTNELIACNGSQQTSETIFRSRGLYVKPGYAGKGLGQLLLRTTAQFAANTGFEKIWSYPRKAAFKTYKAAGFTIGEVRYDESYVSSGVMQHQWNAYAEMKLK